MFDRKAEVSQVSYDDGWAAINLDMPPRVPRTEYSTELHFDLLAAVTGIEVSVESPSSVSSAAVAAFQRAWNFDFFWSTLIGGDQFGQMRTHMGHAEYMSDMADFDPVISSAFTDPEAVLSFDPCEAFPAPETAALTRRFEDHYRRNCAAHPDGVNMTGIYITCVSGLIDIFGWDMLLLAAGLDPERFGALTTRYTDWIAQYFEALAAADVPLVMIHDDIAWTSGPFISPDWYRRFVFPAYRRLFAALIDTGKKIIFTSDGDYTLFLDDLAACGVHGFVLEPATDMRLLAEKFGRTHVLIGNADTRVLLYGSRSQIRAEVERCIDVGKSCPGYFLAVGNHIPPNTPVENALYYNEVYEKMSRR